MKYVPFHFIILFSIEPVDWTLDSTHRGNKSYVGLVTPTWTVCDGTWVRNIAPVIQSAFVGSKRIVYNAQPARKGWLAIWAI